MEGIIAGVMAGVQLICWSMGILALIGLVQCKPLEGK